MHEMLEEIPLRRRTFFSRIYSLTYTLTYTTHTYLKINGIRRDSRSVEFMARTSLEEK